MTDMITFEETGDFKKPTIVVKGKSLNLAHAESQDMFRRLIDRGQLGVFIADIKGYLFYVNQAFVVTLGFETKDDVLGMNLADLIFKDPGRRAEFLKRINEKGTVGDFDVELTRVDHMHVVLSVTSHRILDDSGEVVGIEGIITNVTEESRLRDELVRERQKLQQLLAFDEAISPLKDFTELIDSVVERTASILEVEKCSLMLLDDETGTLSIAGARGLSDEVIKQTQVKLGEMIAGAVVREGQPLLVRNIEYDRKFQRSNRPTYLGRSFMIVPITMGERNVGVINVADKKRPQGHHWDAGLEEIFNDVDLRILCAIAREVSVAFENVKLYKELSSLAVTDPLTHIFNYRQFAKSLDYEIKRAHRNNIPLCVMIIDVDDFKSYNDEFGRNEGDMLLKELGQIFRDQLREVDIICRYAGDEFAIILPDTDVEGARRAAEKIRSAAARFKFKTDVTLGFGVAGYTEGKTQYRLVQEADGALFRAKKEGKNRICVSRE